MSRRTKKARSRTRQPALSVAGLSEAGKLARASGLHTVETLAKEHDCSEQTIRNLLDEIKAKPTAHLLSKGKQHAGRPTNAYDESTAKQVRDRRKPRIVLVRL